MGKREKVMFTIFVVIVQVLQFLLVYSIAWLNNRTIEFLFIFFSFQMNRMVFGNGFGAWFWVILILLFCNNGWGNNNIANDTLLDDEFIKRDIFNTNQNVSNSACQTQRDVLESRYTTQLGMQNLQASQQECCCTTQRAIDNVVAQDYKNTCEITTAIHAEGEATRALINANTMQELRDRLADRDRDLLTANFQLSQQAQSANIISTLQPTPKPAYLTCSPYYAYNSGACFCNGCGCNGTTL